MLKLFSLFSFLQVEYDPDNPDVTYAPDHLFPCKENNPDSGLSCDDFDLVSDIFDYYTEIESRDSHSCNGGHLLGSTGFGFGSGMNKWFQYLQ